MIQLRNVVKYYKIQHGRHMVLDGIDLTIHRGEKLGILGKNGSGKSTLIKLIAGSERPSSGTLIRRMSVSWPLAFGGAFQGSLTGLDNLKFICRIYGVDYRDKIDYVQSFAELGKFFYEPVKTYSAGMSSRLAFAISMSVEFDCYLIDEVIAVGDDRFHKKCQEELFEKRKDRAMVIVSHEPHNIRNHCEHAAVLVKGKLCMFDDIDSAYEFYSNIHTQH